MFMNSHIKLYKYLSICAIALLFLGRTIRKVFDIGLMPRLRKNIFDNYSPNVWSYILV